LIDSTILFNTDIVLNVFVAVHAYIVYVVHIDI